MTRRTKLAIAAALLAILGVNSVAFGMHLQSKGGAVRPHHAPIAGTEHHAN